MKGQMLICFFFTRVNTEENLFFFVTTQATKIPLILPVYFGDVHDVLQRFKSCQAAEFICVDPSYFKMCGPLGKQPICR